MKLKLSKKIDGEILKIFLIENLLYFDIIRKIKKLKRYFIRDY
jgi:hypothetical protein